MTLNVALFLVPVVLTDTMRVISCTSSGQPDLCFSLHSPQIHRDDATVVAVRCDSVPAYSDKADFSRLDHQSLLLSGLSGQCVHRDPEIGQVSCSSVTRGAHPYTKASRRTASFCRVCRTPAKHSIQRERLPSPEHKSCSGADQHSLSNARTVPEQQMR